MKNLKKVLSIAATLAAIFALNLLVFGCVGNKAEAEITGIKIERKPSAGEEANSWARAVHTLWKGESDGSD